MLTSQLCGPSTALKSSPQASGSDVVFNPFHCPRPWNVPCKPGFPMQACPCNLQALLTSIVGHHPCSKHQQRWNALDTSVPASLCKLRLARCLPAPPPDITLHTCKPRQQISPTRPPKTHCQSSTSTARTRQRVQSWRQSRHGRRLRPSRWWCPR